MAKCASRRPEPRRYPAPQRQRKHVRLRKPRRRSTQTRKRAHIAPGIIWTTIANGSVVPNQRIIVHTMTIGRHTLHNVQMSVGEDGAPVLLGLSELSAIGSFTIDQAHNQIRFN